MRSHLRTGRLAAVELLVAAGCVDTNPTDPSSVESPSLAILDGSTGGSPDFYFLPPISDINPNPVGTFNPNLLPSVRVCELEGDPGTPCVQEAPIADFAPGAATAGSGQYTLSWDTDGPETGRFNTNRFYRLEVLVGDSVLGWIELDPQNPNGPGQSTADAYAFRVGETIPVKFWLSTNVLCDGEAFVTECITGAVIDETGGTLALEQAGAKLGVIIFEESLPGVDHPPVTITIERIDAALFLASTGTECLPLFDAPQFGECFRVSTVPELDAPLDIPALVSVCLDPTLLDGINLSEEQQNQLTMVRFADNGTDAWEALPDAAGDCPVTEASLIRVPESGLFRYAALGINAVAGFVGPQPLEARDIRLGALTSSFSRFRYALPGQMVATSGDGSVLQAGDPNTIDATINVVDHEGLAVENATVHFASIDGTLSATNAMTDAAGNATIEWTVDLTTPGEKTLTASALGLLDGPVPEHSIAYEFTAESVDLTVTVVGPPAVVVVDPTETIQGVAGESAGNLTVQALDAAGNPVSGATVDWSGDGTVTGGTETGADGSATGEWTLSTSAGDNTITATVGSVTGSFTAVGAAGPAAVLTQAGGGTALAGSTIPLSITVTDQYGNPRDGDAVTWSVQSGGGSISGSDTMADGSASADWTLGGMPGANSAYALVGGLRADFTATGECFDGWGTASVDGSFDGEWACARSLDFSANISGGSTPATLYWMNDNDRLYFAVRIMQPAISNKNSIRLDIDVDGDGIAEAFDDIIGYDADQQRALDQFLTARCANNNQSGCGRNDNSMDVAGAVANDGVYTTYELSQHLAGDANGEDLVAAAGDQLGFFLTVRVGNGAQGNTQVPGFRDYRSITIVGPGS